MTDIGIEEEEAQRDATHAGGEDPIPEIERIEGVIVIDQGDIQVDMNGHVGAQKNVGKNQKGIGHNQENNLQHQKKVSPKVRIKVKNEFKKLVIKTKKV
jgi:hypothetical protein